MKRPLCCVIAILSASAFANAAQQADRPMKKAALCGDINTIQPTPLSKSPFEFAFDSDSNEVYLLPSPDGRYLVVQRHGSCDSTYIGVWDKTRRIAYGDRTVTLGYAAGGVCWDPRAPVVFFFNVDEGGDAETSGLYKWEFRKQPGLPVRLDSPSAVIRAFNKDTISADLLAIDAKGSNLLINVATKFDSGDDGNASIVKVDKLYVYSLRDRAFIQCGECTMHNWESKIK